MPLREKLFLMNVGFFPEFNQFEGPATFHQRNARLKFSFECIERLSCCLFKEIWVFCRPSDALTGILALARIDHKFRLLKATPHQKWWTVLTLCSLSLSSLLSCLSLSLTAYDELKIQFFREGGKNPLQFVFQRLRAQSLDKVGSLLKWEPNFKKTMVF